MAASSAWAKAAGQREKRRIENERSRDNVIRHLLKIGFRDETVKGQ